MLSFNFDVYLWHGLRLNCVQGAAAYNITSIMHIERRRGMAWACCVKLSAMTQKRRDALVDCLWVSMSSRSHSLSSSTGSSSNVLAMRF